MITLKRFKVSKRILHYTLGHCFCFLKVSGGDLVTGFGDRLAKIFFADPPKLEIWGGGSAACI